MARRVLLQRRVRRTIGAALIAVGVALMVLTPSSSSAWLVLGVAIALEIAGLHLERRD